MRTETWSRLSVMIVAITVGAVAALVVIPWALHQAGSATGISALLVWVFLPLLGVLATVPGLRAGRSRWAVAGLVGNLAVWLCLFIAYPVAVLVLGP